MNNIQNKLIIAETSVDKVIEIEWELNKIYKKFKFLTTENQMKSALDKFEDLLVDKDDAEDIIENTIQDIKKILSTFGRTRGGYVDEMKYNLQIRKMNKMMNNLLKENIEPKTTEVTG